MHSKNTVLAPEECPVITGLETFFTLNYKTIIALEIITVELRVVFIFGGSKERADCRLFLETED